MSVGKTLGIAFGWARPARMAVLVVPAAVLMACVQTAVKHHPNGRKSEEFEYRLFGVAGASLDTVRSGKSRTWDTSGNRLSEEYFRDGKRHGIGRNWSSSGMLRSRIHIRDGQADSGTFWTEDGKVSDILRGGPEVDTVFRVYPDGTTKKLLSAPL